jgi:hypothetical protein
MDDLVLFVSKWLNRHQNDSNTGIPQTRSFGRARYVVSSESEGLFGRTQIPTTLTFIKNHLLESLLHLLLSGRAGKQKNCLSPFPSYLLNW